MLIKTRNVDLSNSDDEKANTYSISIAIIILTIDMVKFNKGFFCHEGKRILKRYMPRGTSRYA